MSLFNPVKKRYVGRDKAEVELSEHKELHWYERLKLGYKPVAWPKRDSDCDDDRFNLKEKETE